MHVITLDMYVTGYNHQNNDNYNQRGKVYCYLKANPEAIGRGMALGELKKAASVWARDEEDGVEGVGESSGARGKKPKRIPWGDKAAELAKAQAQSPPDL